MLVSAKVLDVTYPPIPSRAPSQVQDLALEALSLLKLDLKNVSFFNEINVILIPTCEEYATAGLSTLRCWSSQNLSVFKTSAISEITNFQASYSKNDDTNFTTKEVITQLYQSEPKLISTNTLTNTIVSELSRSLISEQINANKVLKEMLKNDSWGNEFSNGS